MKRAVGEIQFQQFYNSDDWPMELPKPDSEVRFHPVRKWRFDFAWINEKIALEIEGGTYTRGGHARMGEAWKDMDKYNRAQVMGWIVLRVTPDMIASDEIIGFIKDAFYLRLEDGYAERDNQ